MKNAKISKKPTIKYLNPRTKSRLEELIKEALKNKNQEEEEDEEEEEEEEEEEQAKAEWLQAAGKPDTRAKLHAALAQRRS